MAPKHTEPDSKRARHLRRTTHAFIRRFGLLEPSRTPCGQPLPVAQAHALMELLQSPGMTHGDLAERLALSKSNVSRMVARMEEQGRVSRRRDEQDGRVVRLRLTAKGRRLAERVNERSLARFAGIVERLPKPALKGVLESLECLTQATAEPASVEDEAPHV